MEIGGTLPVPDESIVGPYRRSPLKQLILLTPFNYFVKKCSFEDKLLNSDRQIDFTEFSKLCAERWKKMTDLQRAPYQEATDRENERLKGSTSTVNGQDSNSNPNSTPDTESEAIEVDEEEKGEIIIVKNKSKCKRKNPQTPIIDYNANEIPVEVEVEVVDSIVVKKARVMKAKKLKDPNAPKRYMSSFFHYSNAKRAEVVQANPTLRIGDIAKILGNFWREMGAEEKKIYEDLALKDKRRYEMDMVAYKMAGQMEKEEVEVIPETCPGSSASSQSQTETDESQN